MHELALCADRVVIIGRGRLLADASMPEILHQSERAGLVRVRTTGPDVLARALLRHGADVVAQQDGVLHVRGMSLEEVGATAGRAGATVLELAAESGSLEDAYLRLTADSVQYQAGGAR